MRNPIILAFSVLLTFASVAVADVMTNADVIKLVKTGLGDETIINVIKNAESTEFDTSTNGIVDLAQHDVSEGIINEIIARDNSGAKALTQEAKGVADSETSALATGDKIDPTEILMMTDEGEHELLYTSAQIRTKARALGLGGVAQYAVLRGTRAQLRTKDRMPEFIVSVPNRAQVDAYLQVASFAVRKNNTREVLIGGGYMSYSTGIHPDRIIAIRTDKLEDQSRATEGYTLYKVSTVQPVIPGEFAVVFYSGEISTSAMASAFGGGNAYFDFGVD